MAGVAIAVPLSRATVNAAVRPVRIFESDCMGYLLESRTSPPGTASELSQAGYGYAAFDPSMLFRSVPLIMIRRGFFSSGITRSSSMCRRPFSSFALRTSTCSASWKRRSN